jgi:hypothetical protein
MCIPLTQVNVTWIAADISSSRAPKKRFWDKSAQQKTASTVSTEKTPPNGHGSRKSNPFLTTNAFLPNKSK